MKARVLLIGDFLEEQWPSMDIVYEMLLRRLGSDSRIEVEGLRPAMRRRFSASSSFAGSAYNGDRLLNRFFDYPRHLKSARRADVFHIVDHSYAQLAHDLPAERTVVTCHDFDAFRSLFEGKHRRPFWFRAMTRRILEGLQSAAAVTCDSEWTQQELVSHGIVPLQRTRVIRLGVEEIFSAEPDEEMDRKAEGLMGPGPHLLHVGSTAPRKRIDVLLEALASLEEVTLIRVGGPLTEPQHRRAMERGVSGRIRTLPFVDRRLLAAIYRRAAVVVLPSEREGFGFPVVEALACGTPVVASDLPVLREVGGENVLYATAGDAAAFAAAVREVLASPRRSAVEVRRWDEAASDFARLYLELADGSSI